VALRLIQSFDFFKRFFYLKIDVQLSFAWWVFRSVLCLPSACADILFYVGKALMQGLEHELEVIVRVHEVRSQYERQMEE